MVNDGPLPLAYQWLSDVGVTTHALINHGLEQFYAVPWADLIGLASRGLELLEVLGAKASEVCVIVGHAWAAPVAYMIPYLIAMGTIHAVATWIIKISRGALHLAWFLLRPLAQILGWFFGFNRGGQ